MILRYISVVVIHCVVIVSFAQEEEFPKITIKNGELKGKFLQSRGGKTYSAFLGIPYAEPPRRFTLAKPVKDWAGIKNAEEYGSACAQSPDSLSPNSSHFGSENCLFINIFSPKIDGNLPVMVFIHGGAFVSGSSAYYDPRYFMDEEVVIATINYRLGALGFLSTGDGEMEANLGLKDQLLALQFVQKNIKAFGGNPDKVTIFRESAGASCVHHHVLSPLSKGLFSRAIIQSGSALGWGIHPKPEKVAYRIGASLGCFPENSEPTSRALLKCLQNKPVGDIVSQNVSEWAFEAVVPFSPTVEAPGKSEQIFIADTPIDILKSGNYNKVPLMFTSCADEGLIYALGVLAKEETTRLLNDDFLRVFPIALQYKDIGLYPYEENWISTQIKDFYFGSKQINKTTLTNLSRLFTDRGFFHPVQNSVELHAKQSDQDSIVYNGLLTHFGKYSVTRLYGIKETIGVTHADDLQYLFHLSRLPNIDPNSRDEVFSKEAVRLWTDFASERNNLTFNGMSWDPIGASTLNKDEVPWFTLEFQPKVLQSPFKERIQFFENLIGGARPGKLAKLGNIIK